jgi:magnesium transporter
LVNGTGQEGIHGTSDSEPHRLALGRHARARWLAAGRRPVTARRGSTKKEGLAVGLPPHEARLFDADRTDRSVELTATTAAEVRDRQLLWIDIRDDAESEAVGALLRLLPIDGEAAQRFWSSTLQPRLRLSGTYFQLRVLAVNTHDGRDRPTALDMLAGTNFVVTIHPEPIQSLAEFRERLEGDTAVGVLDSGAFAAVLLDGFVTSYLELSDELAATVDRLDEQALRPAGGTDLLGQMVALRHRIAAARRTLAAHREVVAALARADFEAIAGTSATTYFQNLAGRFDHAIDAIDGGRESLVGTFDIHMTRTSQRTNGIMRTLTIVSVILLPAGVISSFMGMNSKPPFSLDDPRIFWIVVVVIAAIAVSTLVMVRVRRWI